MPPPLTLPRIDRIRRFSRTFTRRIAVLSQRVRGSQFNLLEGNILVEMGIKEVQLVDTLAQTVNVDPVECRASLMRLQKLRIVELDGPSVSITRQGRAALASLEAIARAGVRSAFGHLDVKQIKELVDAMSAIERLLKQRETGDAAPSLLPAQRSKRLAKVLIRHHRPGDLGHIVARHGALYAEQYGWDERFEALVARVAAEFIETYEVKRSRAFIAEFDGATIGSAVVVDAGKGVAKLRLVYVETELRGIGAGRKLVEEAITFAREAGYGHMTLWTNDVLVEARGLYESLGFQMTDSRPHEDFGKPVVGETWSLRLTE